MVHHTERNNKTPPVKKGWLAVHVGTEDEELRRFVIPISYLYHPSFRGLLENTWEVYGYHAAGPLRIACSIDDFLHLLWVVEKEATTGGGSSNRYRQTRRSSSTSNHDHHHHHHHLPYHKLPSFHSC